MEYFMSIFLGGWMILFGVLFVIVMNKEFSGYLDDKDKKGDK